MPGEPKSDRKRTLDEYALTLGKRISEAADRIGGKRILAKETSLLETQIHKYCRGENIPRVSVITDIARATGVSVEWLALGETAEQGKVVAEKSGGGYVCNLRSDSHSFEDFRDILFGMFLETKRDLDWLSDQTTIALPRLDAILAGKDIPASDEFERIMDWLQRVPPCKKLEGTAYNTVRSDLILRERVCSGRYGLLPMVPVEDKDLSGHLTADFAFENSWLEELSGGHTGDLTIARIRDDAMSPFLAPGDIMIIKCVRKFNGSGVYVYKAGEGIEVRRISQTVDGGLIIKADNPLYEPQQIEKENIAKFTCRGRVVWIGKKV